MIHPPLPKAIASILATYQAPDALFSNLLPALGEFLRCDRCFLYLRYPQTRRGRVPFCWVRTPDVPVVYDADWKPEPPSLPEEDPMFAAALRAEPSIFIEDVQTADPQILNQQFEQESFGHRALIHAHLCQDGELWGVLQPCIFHQPRVWNEDERLVIQHLVQKITPAAVAYVNANAS
jgi:GAF domain-containing protein